MVLLTGPVEEPVGLEEAKLHLRVSTAADDALIGSLIAAARGYVESHLRRALVTQVWDLYLDAFPAGKGIELAMPPLRAVESVTFFGDDGTEGAMSSLEYLVDTVGEPGAVVLAKGRVGRRRNCGRGMG